MLNACAPRREWVSGILLARTGFRYPAQTRVPTRCKRGRWARSRQALLVVYVPQQHSEVPDTILLLLLYHVSYNKIEATKKCGASRYDLQQQRSRIMMHPSYHRAARRQRRSHAPIPSRQPRSVRTSIWSMSRACYVRACHSEFATKPAVPPHVHCLDFSCTIYVRKY